MKGYKAFESDLTCRGFQYEIGKTYEMDENEIEICEKGFHFCDNIKGCYDYYPKNNRTRICEVEALGQICGDGNKYCTNKIKIIAEIDGNIKNCNAGYFNTGNYNIGNFNAGYFNTGNYNIGNSNIGDFNAGDFNTGDFNTGDFNTGDCNSGNHNSGNWNAGDFNTGYLCTQEPELLLFDKPSKMTRREFYRSRAYEILCNCPFSTYQYADNTLVKFTPSERRKWWDDLSEDDKNEIMNLPNFDMEKFKKCMQMEDENG